MRTYLLIALLPWLIFFAFADGTSVGLFFGSFGGLIFLFIFGFRALRKFFSFAWFTLIVLFIMLIIDFSWPKSFLVHYSLFAATIILALFSFVTLVLHRPFTLSYAKIQAAEVYWKHPVFIQVNYWLSAVWGLVFLFYALVVLLFYLGIGTKLWMMQILPTASLVFAIGFMIFFPDVYKTRFMKKGMIAAIPGISEVNFVKMENVTIGYRTIGKGELVILTYGMLMNMHNWDPDLLKKLSEKFQVLIFDYPGIGYSTYKNMQFSMDTIVDCLYGLIDKLKLKPRAIIGYSLGGFVAQKFATKYPQMLQALVLISSMCGGDAAVWCDEEIAKKIERSLDKDTSGEEQFNQMMSIMFTAQALPRFMPRMKKIIISAAIEGLVSFEMQQKEREVVEGFRDNNQLAEQITKVKLPVLVIAGKQDMIVPFANAEVLVRKFSNAKLVSYDDAGHGLIYQYPLDIADEIKKFLA